jgi:hypothetical protein
MNAKPSVVIMSAGAQNKTTLNVFLLSRLVARNKAKIQRTSTQNKGERNASKKPAPIAANPVAFLMAPPKSADQPRHQEDSEYRGHSGQHASRVYHNHLHDSLAIVLFN